MAANSRHFSLAALAAGGLLLLAGAAFAEDAAKPFWPADAKVFFIEPKDGAVIEGPVQVKMGAEGITIAPAGTDQPNTGHHHILVDTTVPTGEAAQFAMPADFHNRHYGKGQTEATLTDLPPGQHTLQLVTGDKDHVPHDPALASEKITITVK